MNDIKKITIGGIKFSEERVLYNISCEHKAQGVIGDLLQQIHQKQVNIPFLCQSCHIEHSKISFCVSQKDSSEVTERIQSLNNKLHVVTHQQIASVTVFPHKKALSFAAIIMGLMESLFIPVYSSCSSISAFVFNVRLSDLNTIATALPDIFELPENHSPFRQEFQLCQPRNETASEVG